MARFNAATAVETLDYDFTAFGGGEGVIPEPSTGAVNRFFKDMKKLIKEVKKLQKAMEDVNLENEDEVAELPDLDEDDSTSEFQEQTLVLIAELCGAKRDDDGELIKESGTPSFNDLEKLPYRVLQEFSKWLMESIRPKKTTPGGPN